MRLRDVLDLVALSALWGASFMFMRIAAPEFGPVALAAMRVAFAAAFLVPVVAIRARIGDLGRCWKKLAITGALSSAVPFCLFSYSTLYVEGGFAAILNATSPIWTAVVAWLWLSDRMSGVAVAGLFVGFFGVVVLVWDSTTVEFGGTLPAILAAIAASMFYGIAGNYIKAYARDVPPLVLAAGSQLAAAILLAPVAVVLWPMAPVSNGAWLAALVMGIVSTGVAYILYFRLIANVGPSRAITVTFLIPGFAMLFGALVLDEAVTGNMLLGCAIILLGTALVTGVITPGRPGAGT